MNRSEMAQVAWALVGVPVAFAAYVLLSYQYSLSQGLLPYTMAPRAVWFIAYFGALGSGVVAIALVRSWQARWRAVLVLAYGALMAAGLFALHVWAACASGDCL